MVDPKEVFLGAVERPVGERAEFVRRACGGDDELRGRVERLLAAHERAEALAQEAEGRGEEPIALVGDYEVLGEVASGAMGTVYRARQIGLGRVVALKVLRVGRFATAAEVRRFRAEAEAAARLDHPNIVPVYDVGEVEGRHYFSMKLVDGPSLDAVVGRFASDPAAAARLVAKVARAVHHAHLHGVLHRDLKPSNVLIDSAGEPHVADFGVAKTLERDADHTATGALVGTPAYMAPEQAVRDGDVTTATDVYALGCILHELLAGEPPFTGDSVLDVLRKAREEEPPRIRALRGRARDLETIARRAMAKEPARRYRSARFLAEDLERWLDHRPIEARPPTLPERAWMLWRRKPVVVALSAAVGVLLLALGVFAAASHVALRDRLRGSLVAQARATRSTPEPGRRHASLDLLEQAARIRPGPDLRDEAITCLTLIDLHEEERFRLEPGDRPIGFDLALGLFVVAAPDGEICVRTFPGNEEVVRLPAPPAPPMSAVLAPGGRFVAVRSHGSGGRDFRLELWDLERRERAWESDVQCAKRSVAFDSAGATLASGGGDTLVLVDTASGRARRIDLSAEALAVDFHPAGEPIAVGTKPDALHFLARDGRTVLARELDGWPSDVAWSPDGSLLAVAGFDFAVHLVDPATGEELRKLSGHEAEVIDVDFPAPGLLASYSWDERTLLWNVRTGEPVLRANARAFSASAASSRLAFEQGGDLGIWQVEGGDVLRTFHGHRGKSPFRIAADPDGTWIASGGDDGVHVWEVATGRSAGLFPAGAVEGVLFGADGDALYTSGELGLAAWSLPAAALEPERAVPRILVEGPCGLSGKSADGSLLAVRRGREVVLVSPAGGSVVGALPGRGGMDGIAVDPAGARVAAGSWRGRGVRVWDARTGEVEIDLLEEHEAVTVAFGPEGRRLVTGTSHEYRIWDVSTWRTERVVPRRALSTSLPGAIAFDPETGLLALEPTSRAIEIVDPDTGAALVELRADVAWTVNDLVFLPNGGGLAAASRANRVQVWDLRRMRAELRARRLDHGLRGLWE